MQGLVLHHHSLCVGCPTALRGLRCRTPCLHTRVADAAIDSMQPRQLMQAADVVAAASFADHSGSRAEYLAYQAQVALLMLLRQTAGGRRVHGAVVSNRVVGVAEVSVEQVPQALAGPCMLPKGVAVAIVSNMAVLQPHRRQGLGRRLLQACYKDAVVGCAVAMLLYVRKDNGVAAELYASEGFEPVEWTDPEWLAAAHRGEVGGARRLLLIRRL